MTIEEAVKGLADYAVDAGLIEKEDRTYAINRILEQLYINDYSEPEKDLSGVPLHELLEKITDWAVEKRLTLNDGPTARDLFDTKIMGVLTPRPSFVTEKFRALREKDPVKATDWFYNFCIRTNYIRADRIKKDLKWVAPTKYGDLDITVNLSKPEKDPKAIAAAKLAPQSAYPKCQLCAENVGYAGRLNHPARQNLRAVPVTINGSDWMFQYSPYVYYNEHCIVFNCRHTPMSIDHATFGKLLDFVSQYPHYFVGSNADLPIVGGSILSHDHFQGGHYTFPMERAGIESAFVFKGFEDVEAGIVNWPMSCLRLRHPDRRRLIETASKVLDVWRGYSDPEAFVFAGTGNEPHNTITPIARFRDGAYELDLVLRNNITTEKHPLGLYHPHEDKHHIKKENIGLIEVMGLAVLPARLKRELALLGDFLVKRQSPYSSKELEKHAPWCDEILDKYPQITPDNVDEILKYEVGQVFAGVLEDAGVYKCTPEGREGFVRFLDSVNKT
ncbi:MAG: UDP-glucose--hexose-1-phosphate uridylyltransferase [Clostridia bacterium]|nr:UDP-glucose--hexose-1-phosphate uridylyltransferase [Clostridia bacterium]